VNLANGLQIHITHCVKDIVTQLNYDSSDSTPCLPVTFLVAPIQYSVILGLPCLSQFNLQVGWQAREVSFSSANAINTLVSLDSVAPAVAISVAKQDYQLPENVPDIYSEFASVIYDPPDSSLPPTRPFDLNTQFKDANNSLLIYRYMISLKKSFKLNMTGLIPTLKKVLFVLLDLPVLLLYSLLIKKMVLFVQSLIIVLQTKILLLINIHYRLLIS
jgi:hypothetical protein